MHFSRFTCFVAASSLSLSIGLAESTKPALAQNFADTSGAGTTAPVYNPSAGTTGTTGTIYSPTTATSATGSNPLGGLGNLGGLGDIGGQLGGAANQIMTAAQGIFQQIQGMYQQIGGMIQKVIGSASGGLGKILTDVMGALNMPDPQELLDQILRGSGDGQNVSNNNISGINPNILKENQAATAAAKIFAQQNFSKEAQQNAKKDLEWVASQVQAAGQFGAASGQLSQQSSQAATQSGQAAQTAQQTAAQAQKRVSTQDAIKDLNTISAQMSAQLSGLSSQSAAQSGQLTNLTQLEATGVQIAGASSAKLTQINQGVAASAQQLADINSQMRGKQQQEIMRDVNLVDRLQSTNSSTYRLLK